MNNLPHIKDDAEARMIDAALNYLLDHGTAITIFDGEDFATAKTTDRDELRAAIGKTPDTTLRLHCTCCGAYRGMMHFIHGQGAKSLNDFGASGHKAEGNTNHDLIEDTAKACRAAFAEQGG